MPNLADVVFYSIFWYENDITVRGCAYLFPLSRLVIGELYPFVNIPSPEMYEYCMNVLRGSGETTDLVIGGGACPFANVTVLDLSVYPRLKSLRIGNNGFEFVNEVKVIGLNELESVEIGMNCFTKKKNSYGNDPNHHFYLKDCPKLKSLKMGRYSFSDYSVIEIENVNALEVIEMGDVNEVSYGFYYASLELKSILIYSE